MMSLLLRVPSQYWFYRKDSSRRHYTTTIRECSTTIAAIPRRKMLAGTTEYCGGKIRRNAANPSVSQGIRIKKTYTHHIHLNINVICERKGDPKNDIHKERYAISFSPTRLRAAA